MREVPLMAAPPWMVLVCLVWFAVGNLCQITVRDGEWGKWMVTLALIALSAVMTRSVPR